MSEKGKKRHINIPIFIPHLGCPNDCVFCNQRSISGKISFCPESVKSEIETALATVDATNSEVEIAFFGGSFTGIDRELMIYLLGVAKEYIDCGKVGSIRLSTRPDYIDTEILDILEKYGVKNIELGIQSMSERVLAASKRGHTADATERACALIKERGFSLVGQMMIGLPAATVEDEIECARRICEMGADAARVYPTVVFYGTELKQMTERAEYIPLDEKSAVERTAAVLKVFSKKGVPCIRVGLQSSENLSSDETVFAGANQSAIGEMAMSEIFYENIRAELEKDVAVRDCDITVFVPIGATSKASGQKRINKLRLQKEYGIKRIKIVEKSELLGYNIRIDKNCRREDCFS